MATEAEEVKTQAAKNVLIKKGYNMMSAINRD